MKLTNKQKQFCKEYLIDLNITQAAIRAGYSKKTADVIGCENLGKPNIQAEVQRLMDERTKRVEIEADDVLRSILRTRNICEEYLLSEGEYGTKIDGVALSGINKNNEMLAKHKKLLTDKVEHSGTVEQKVTIIDDI